MKKEMVEMLQVGKHCAWLLTLDCSFHGQCAYGGRKILYLIMDKKSNRGTGVGHGKI